MTDSQMPARGMSKSMSLTAFEFDPDGKPEGGMIPTIVDIKLAKESKRWDMMVQRIVDHLEEQHTIRDMFKKRTKADMIKAELEAAEKAKAELE